VFSPCSKHGGFESHIDFAQFLGKMVSERFETKEISGKSNISLINALNIKKMQEKCVIR
jgi:hypothetical protein